MWMLKYISQVLTQLHGRSKQYVRREEKRKIKEKKQKEKENLTVFLGFFVNIVLSEC